MVAPNAKFRLNDRDLEDAGKALFELWKDFTCLTQLKSIQVERTRDLTNTKLMLGMREYILKDNFGNIGVVFVSKLMDDELHTVTAWVGTERWTGTQKAFVPAREYKNFGYFSDALLAYLQDSAFVVFGRTTLAILKGRQAANMPLSSPTPESLQIRVNELEATVAPFPAQDAPKAQETASTGQPAEQHKKENDDHAQPEPSQPIP